ncbi:hypothetical protein [Jiangella anatolica]|uniref:Uncharacterized protein n=1 Tax=Jiangella anatolica TaxID=2670374 RepID=A0A2W2BZ95_9ACTN|nr:hypothetical protein [Jiangella anatolica]PZF85168.1 hypothetical protein C1I92_06220 [Jiangella anatolica]
MITVSAFDISVVADASMPVTTDAFPNCAAGPFVTVVVAGRDARVAFLVHDLAVLDAFAAVIPEARANLVAALSKVAA